MYGTIRLFLLESWWCLGEGCKVEVKHYGRLPFLAEAQKSAEFPHPYFLTPHHGNPPFTLFQTFCLVTLPYKSSLSLCAFFSLPSASRLYFPSTNSPRRDFRLYGNLWRPPVPATPSHCMHLAATPGLADSSNGTLCKLPFRKVEGGGLEESKPQEERGRRKHFSEGQNM